MKTRNRPTHGDGQTATRFLQPMCCEACGAELEIRCPKGCEDGPPAPRPMRPAAPAPKPATPVVRGTNKARTYQPKKCRKCPAIFTPKGPRALDCEACR